jgi:glycerol kinase
MNTVSFWDKEKGQWICHVAVWDCELTADEVFRIASGDSPLTIRPDRLKSYSPMHPTTVIGGDAQG